MTTPRTALQRMTARELRAAIRFRDGEIAKLEEKVKPLASGDVFHAFTGLAQRLGEKAKRLNGMVELLEGLRFVVPGDGDALRVLEDSIREIRTDCTYLEVAAWGRAKSFAHNDHDRESAGNIVEGHLQRITSSIGAGKRKEAAA